MNLLERYQKLVAIGIDKTANLPELNDMTDRGENPLKPWTAAKTIGTIDLIKRHNITDEETFIEKFQAESKIKLEILTDQVYEHQKIYFGKYKYDKDTVFKYTYCCIVLNSLRGNNTEKRFDSWASSKNIITIEPPLILDQKFHTDRLEIDDLGNLRAFISIKPNSFKFNYLQYTDVFAGLQVLTIVTGIPWKIYYRNGENFNLIQFKDLNPNDQSVVNTWANGYSKHEVDEIKFILNDFKNSIK